MYSANYLIFDRHYCIIALLHYCIMSFVLCTLFTHAQIPKIPTLHIYILHPFQSQAKPINLTFSPHPHFLLLILDHPIFQQHSPSPPTCTRYAHNPNPIQQNSKRDYHHILLCPLLLVFFFRSAFKLGNRIQSRGNGPHYDPVDQGQSCVLVPVVVDSFIETVTV